MQFSNPVSIVSSPGARGKLASNCGSKELLIICTQSAFERYINDEKLSLLFSLPNSRFEHNFSSNPAMEDIVKISKKYSDANLDLIVGLGGGSAMDVAKIASVSIPAAKKGITLSELLANGALFDTFGAIDCMQVPTTAGTGSEVTPFATVWDYDSQQKKSLSHPNMFAKACYIDSDFLIDIPLNIALSTGLDALNQALESIWNKNASDISLLYAMKAAELSLKALPKLSDLSEDPNLRQELMIASVFAGVAISQTRTAICHSISYPLTLRFNLPHGLACAFSMLEVLDFNSALISKELDGISAALSGVTVEEIIISIFEKHNVSKIIQSFIPSEDSVLNIMDEMYTSGRFENNIKNCSKKDLENIINKSCKRIF
ncbi:MAG: phosphonoacetaldehyde reductase [Candidatus Neomarinimicrobiota bacterium]